MDTEGACFDPRTLGLDTNSMLDLEFDAPDFADTLLQPAFSQTFGGKPSPGSTVTPSFFFDAASVWHPDQNLYNGEPAEILPELSHSSVGDAESSPSDIVKMESPVDAALTEMPQSPAQTRARPTRGGSKTRSPPKPKARKTAASETHVPPPQPPAPAAKIDKVQDEHAKVEKAAKEKPASRKRPKRAVANPPREADVADHGEGDTRQKFLARNRVAASKCRLKKKEYVESMQEDLRKLEEKNHELREAYQSLMAERTVLKDVVMGHGHCKDANISAWIQLEAGRVGKSKDSEARAERALASLVSTSAASQGPQAGGSASVQTDSAGSTSRDGSVSQTSPTTTVPSAPLTDLSPPANEESETFSFDHMPDSLFEDCVAP